MIKGANYFYPRYIRGYPSDPEGYEMLDTVSIYHDLRPNEIEWEWQLLKKNLGVNSIRMLTPSQELVSPNVQYHNYAPWYESDGRITQLKLQQLQQLLKIAERNDMYVTITIIYGLRQYIEFKDGVVDPGSSRAIFYENYVKSITEGLKGYPALLAFEIESEILLDSSYNYWTQDGSEAKKLSFMIRMINAIKQVDPSRLIMSGEVAGAPKEVGEQYTSLWWWPAPELGLIPDIHNLAGGSPQRLIDHVDILSPHIYINSIPGVDSIITSVRQAAPNKAIVFGEAGYLPNPLEYVSTKKYEPEQELFFTEMANSLKNNHINGTMVFWPLSPFNLKPGNYDVIPPTNPLWFGSPAYIFDDGRKIRFYTDIYELLDYQIRPNKAGLIYSNSVEPINHYDEADLNADDAVNLLDFNLLLTKFGNPYTIFDFNAIVTNYGK